MVATKVAKAPTKKVSPSPTMQKKAKKAKVAAQKEANKSKVRVTRSTRRTEVANAKAGDKLNKKSKAAKIGQAPQSARIGAIRGPIRPIAARTQFVGKHSDDRKWLIIDAAGQTVGRLASEIAMLLRGKHKPTFTPHNDAGDFVVVINANQVVFGATKNETKEYYSHTGYIGGLKVRTPATLRAKDQAERILRMAVKGMVPRSPLGRDQMGKLNIYNGAEHPHAAQKPLVWKLRYSVSK